MTAQIHFFPVGNGDMTLITTETGKALLIDCNIRKAADADDDDTFDVASELRGILERDDDGRLHVDAMLLSHPDQDHISGFQSHFHLGAPENWNETDDKIVIDEMWSSPIVFRRLSSDETLCDDAKAWRKEAKRRVKLFEDHGRQQVAGQEIIILGEDIDGKTDNLSDIVAPIGETISLIRSQDAGFDARLIGPIPDDEVGEDEKEKLSKNNSSVIVNFSIHADGDDEAVKFLTGGDAEVEVWEEVWARESEDLDTLSYDILQAPHHCSWRSLSHESWSENGGKAEVSESAYEALSQALDGAVVVSSSKPVKDEDTDPPCVGARDKYEQISNVSDFFCTGEYPSESNPKRLTIEASSGGWQTLPVKVSLAAAAAGVTTTAAKSRGHG